MCCLFAFVWLLYVLFVVLLRLFVECYYFVYKLFRVSWDFVILRLGLLGLFRGGVSSTVSLPFVCLI